MKGLFRSPKGRANCLYIGERLIDCTAHSIHHMLSYSPWSYQQLFDQIFKQALKALQAHKRPIYLLIDEVGFRKKGKHSACVGKQYLGCIGKQDNGQVAVTAALSSAEFYVPVEMELFMPSDWSKDKKRRKKAGIPMECNQMSKPQIALKMIHKMAKKIKGLEFVIFDALYGSCTELLASLIESKIPFIAEVRENITFYLQEPTMGIPIKKSGGKGRQFTVPRPNKKSISARNYATQLNLKKNFKPMQVRMGTKGPVKGIYHRRKVWVYCKQTSQFLPMHLLIRINKDGTHKFAFCYHSQPCSVKRMAVAQAQRVFVERVFEEGKNITGMGDYQVRSWNGFHKHMALTSLTLLYIMENKLKQKPGNKITAYDIQELINTTIIFITTLDQISNQIRNKNARLNRAMTRIKKKG